MRHNFLWNSILASAKDFSYSFHLEWMSLTFGIITQRQRHKSKNKNMVIVSGETNIAINLRSHLGLAASFVLNQLQKYNIRDITQAYFLEEVLYIADSWWKLSRPRCRRYRLFLGSPPAYLMSINYCSYTRLVLSTTVKKYGWEKFYHLWWIPNSVSRGFCGALRTDSSRGLQGATYMSLFTMSASLYCGLWFIQFRKLDLKFTNGLWNIVWTVLQS